MKIRQIIGGLFISVLPFFITAQQDAQYTQYMYNTLSVNPAYAGSKEALSFTGLYRAQWVGLEGAPKTQTLGIHTPVGKNVGLGLSVVHDEIGPTVETYIDAVFSYTFSVSEEGKLSFGLKAGGHLLDVDFAKLNQYVSQLTGGSNIDNKFSPNIGAGIYYRTSTFYAGLSAPNFLKTKHFDESSDSNDSASFIATERINLYFITGKVFDINSSWMFKPAILLKMVSGAPLQVDISANFLYNNRITMGAAYRYNAAWSALFGFQITDGFMIGITYDKDTSVLGNSTFNNGSFEIMMRFELQSKKNITSPRFF